MSYSQASSRWLEQTNHEFFIQPQGRGEITSKLGVLELVQALLASGLGHFVCQQVHCLSILLFIFEFCTFFFLFFDEIICSSPMYSRKKVQKEKITWFCFCVLTTNLDKTHLSTFSNQLILIPYTSIILVDNGFLTTVELI